MFPISDCIHKYSSDVDILKIYFAENSPGFAKDSDIIFNPTMILDWDSEKKLVAIEIRCSIKEYQWSFLEYIGSSRRTAVSNLESNLFLLDHFCCDVFTSLTKIGSILRLLKTTTVILNFFQQKNKISN